VIYDNGEPVSGFRMNRISYDDTRGINAHIDYRTRALGGPYYQLLFELPGYTHSIYRQKDGGRIRLDDNREHDIRIALQDAYGNTSTLSFRLRYRPVKKAAPVFEGKMFYPFMLDGYETEDCAFYLGERSLYDSVHLSCRGEAVQTPTVVSRLQHIGTTTVPIGDSVIVRIKATVPLADKSHVLMQRFDKEDQEVSRVQWQDEWATAAFRSFGNFQLVIDTVPPAISFPGMSPGANLQRSARIVVRVQDNFKQIRNFRAMLDGEWILFSNDKAKAFIYDFDEHCPPGRHELRVTAEDVAGNVGEAAIAFER
jgi:hypothetical protein